MCTCFKIKGNDLLIGRNMDIEYTFGEKVVIVPREYNWTWRETKNLSNSFAMMGIATIFNDYPLFAEAVNEKGLVMASLNFPDNAYYFDKIEGKHNLTPFELIPYVLKHFETVKEAKQYLKDLNLINQAFSENLPLAPLHFILMDENDCIVIESEKDGLHIYDNPTNVLTNNPQLPSHLVNLENYRNLQVKNPENNLLNKEGKIYGQGLGAFGLPGDSSPMSRFVQTCFYKSCSELLEKEQINESQVLLILQKVSMLRGCVKTKEDKWDITSYSACINSSKLTYFIKTYDNLNVFKVSLLNENLDSKNLIVYEFPKNLEVNSLN